jgi:hypothetical protein
MSDTLAILNAVSEPISTPEAPMTGTYWSPSTLSDHITCTIVGTNPQIAESRSLILSPSTCEGFSSEELTQRPAALFSSLSATPRRASKGKSRKAREKDLENLKGWQVDDLFRADATADSLGLGMNLFMTVTPLIISAFQIGLRRAGQWLSDNGVAFVYIYVHENPGGERPHSHLLIHVPQRLIKAFVSHAGGWFGAANETDVRVEPRTMPGWSRRRRLQYLVKGAHHCVCKAHGGHRKKGGQGPIEFKRSGVCQFLRSEFGGKHDTWGGPSRKEKGKVEILMSGEELKTLRDKSGLSQTRLADLAGLHRNSVGRLEKMPIISQTSSDALKRIMRALGENTPNAYRR